MKGSVEQGSRENRFSSDRTHPRLHMGFLSSVQNPGHIGAGSVPSGVCRGRCGGGDRGGGRGGGGGGGKCGFGCTHSQR